MSEITKDQIESWKRDSEILSEIDDSLNPNDDWNEQELFMKLLDTYNPPHPSDLLYHIWQRRNPTEPRNARGREKVEKQERDNKIMTRYNKKAVDKRIKIERNYRKISNKESKLIHALLKGRQKTND